MKTEIFVWWWQSLFCCKKLKLIEYKIWGSLSPEKTKNFQFWKCVMPFILGKSRLLYHRWIKLIKKIKRACFWKKKLFRDSKFVTLSKSIWLKAVLRHVLNSHNTFPIASIMMWQETLDDVPTASNFKRIGTLIGLIFIR